MKTKERTRKIFSIGKNEFYVTKITTKNSANKTFYLSSTGELEKNSDFSFSHGEYVRERIKTKDLLFFLEHLTTYDCLVAGTHEFITRGKISSKKNVRIDEIVKTNENFPHRALPGLLFIDIDSAGAYGINSMDDIFYKLEKIIPNLHDICAVATTSASSNIKVYNKLINGLNGAHVYIPIDDASKIPEVLMILHKKSIINGMLNNVITKDGKLKIDSLVDIAYCSSSQSCSEGGANIEPEFQKYIKQEREVVSLTDSFEMMKSSDIINSFTDEDEFNYDQICYKIYKELEDDIKTTRENWFSSSKFKNVDKKELKQLKNSNKKGVLNKDFFIEFEDGNMITVGEIFNDLEKYNKIKVLHPILGRDDKLGRTILYTNKDNCHAMICTFTNGGKSWKLVNK